MDNAQRWAVMILAHNEEERIVACLDSLYLGEPGKPIDAYVMANGCTDRTESLVREYAAKEPSVHLVSIRLGDKNNAWNVFIHETVQSECPDREVYFFMDGDAMIAPGSLSVLAQALRDDPVAHAASAVPGSGRSMKHDRDEILSKRGLVANLYALRGSFVQRLRATSVRLPLNLEGDDGLIGALVKWDLDPRGPWNDALIHPCADAKFLFEPVPVARLSEWPKYWKRLVRYGRRHYEFQLLGPLLRERGIGALPVNIQQIYAGAQRLPFVWRGAYTPAFAVALRQMRRIGQQQI
jgi:glycosyltransferase involved in cell wall biosynthesis